MFELIATGSGPLSRVYNDLALSPLSNSSPAAIAFAKPRAERFFRLPPTPAIDLEDICREKRQLYRVGWSQQTWQHEHCRNCRHEDIFGYGCASSPLEPLPALGRWFRLGELSCLQYFMSL
jgi:hypothetical protein